MKQAFTLQENKNQYEIDSYFVDMLTLPPRMQVTFY